MHFPAFVGIPSAAASERPGYCWCGEPVRVRTLRRGAGALPALSLTDLRKGFSAISTDQTSLHQHFRLQRPVDRAPLGDLRKPPALRHLQRATQLELETNTVDLPVLGLAFLAIPPIHLLVL